MSPNIARTGKVPVPKWATFRLNKHSKTLKVVNGVRHTKTIMKWDFNDYHKTRDKARQVKDCYESVKWGCTVVRLIGTVSYTVAK